MTHWRVSGTLLGVVALLFGATSQADGLRCGDRLASTGSSLYDVRSTCGDPDDAQHSTEMRVVQQRVLVPCPAGSGRRMCEVWIEQTVEVAVDRWTYDFGSNRFVEFARFEQGVLVNVTNGSYGHKEPTRVDRRAVALRTGGNRAKGGWMRSTWFCALAIASFVSLTACGSDGGGSGGSGGAVGSSGAGGANNAGGAAGAGSLCQRGCVATLAAACSNGPTSQSDCEATCQTLETGSCGTLYQALQSCADGQAITCSSMGMPTIAACSSQQSAFVACLN